MAHQPPDTGNREGPVTKGKFKIDKRTGLPELPENQYWEIIEDTEPTRYYEGLSFEYKQFREMRLYRDNTGRHKEVTKRRWWGKKYTASVLDEQPELLARGRINKGAQGVITKESCLDAAMDVLERHQAKLEADTLIGKYPPNKLDAGF